MSTKFPFVELISGAASVVLQFAAGQTGKRIITLPGDTPTVGQSFRVASIGGSPSTIVLEYYTPSVGGGGGSIAFAANPTSIFDVSGSGTSSITLSLDAQSPNTILAGPVSGGATTPAFRVLVDGDIPVLSTAKITSGTFDVARLPVGQTSTTVAAGNDTRFHNQNTDTGTNALSFQIDTSNTGPRIKNNAGVLEVRNAADSALADLNVRKITAQQVDYAQVNTVAYGDAIVDLNADYTGSTPTENAGVRVNRGSLTAAFIGWDESNDRYMAGLEGSELPLARIASGTFTSANLTAGVLTVTHNLGRQYVVDRYYDQNGDAFTPQTTATSGNVLSANFGTATVTGTWSWVVYG